jgi:hypothetical protein
MDPFNPDMQKSTIPITLDSALKIVPDHQYSLE